VVQRSWVKPNTVVRFDPKTETCPPRAHDGGGVVACPHGCMRYRQPGWLASDGLSRDPVSDVTQAPFKAGATLDHRAQLQRGCMERIHTDRRKSDRPDVASMCARTPRRRAPVSLSLGSKRTTVFASPQLRCTTGHPEPRKSRMVATGARPERATRGPGRWQDRTAPSSRGHSRSTRARHRW